MTSKPLVTTDVAAAADVLLNGGIIGLPTETVYGLAAIATDEQAVMRIFSTKGRPTNHPLILHLGPLANPEDWGVFNISAKRLAEEFWPGPLTLLVPRTSRVPDWVTGGRDTVAIRVPSHPLAQELLNAVGTGVVAPSANRFGKVSPTTAQHVVDDLGSEVDLVLDGGSSEVGLESTIVECVGDEVRILRPGVISSDDIVTIVSVSRTRDNEESRASGMLASHYAPRAEVRLFETVAAADSEITVLTQQEQHVVLLNYDDLFAYAENLYADLRKADNRGATIVCAVMPPDIGVGAAIRDRLMKAAHRS